MESGDAVIVRPSGTEPKIKIYITAKASSREEAENKLYFGEFKQYDKKFITSDNGIDIENVKDLAFDGETLYIAQGDCLIEYADARSLRYHLRVFCVKLRYRSDTQFKFGNLFLVNIDIRGVCSHPGRSRGRINCKNALTGIEIVSGIA